MRTLDLGIRIDHRPSTGVLLRVIGERSCCRTLPPRTSRDLVPEFLDGPDLECIFMRTFLRLTPVRYRGTERWGTER